MAANITLSAVTIAAGGKTVTATIGGGSGSGYAITDGTGLIPKLNNGVKHGFKVVSASVSGSTLTVVTDAEFGTSEAVQFDILTDSNLTDSSGNSPQGQSDLAVTNNSTVVVTSFFVGPNAGLFELNGDYSPTDFGIVAIGINQRWQQTSSDNWPVEFAADATSVTALVYNQPNALRVDGATSTTNPSGNPSSNWRAVNLASGLSADTHLFLLEFGNFFMGVRLVGGNRTMRSVATTKRAITSRANASLSVPATTQVTAWGRRTPDGFGSIGIGGGPGGTVIEFAYTGSGVEFQATGSGGTSLAVSNDGGDPGALVTHSYLDNQNATRPVTEGLPSGSHTLSAMYVSQTSNTVVFGVKIINGTRITGTASAGATTLTVLSASTLVVGAWVKIDKAAAREWRRVTAITGTTVTLNAALASTHAAGTTVTSYEAPAATISVNTRTRTKRYLALGDSNTQGSNIYGGDTPVTPDEDGNYYAGYDPRWFPGFIAADPANIDVINAGVQGTTTAQIAASAAGGVTASLGSFDYASIWSGTNDINGAGSSYTTAQYKADVLATINTLLPALNAGGKIILMPPLTPHPVTAGTAGGLTLSTAATALAQLAAADPSHVVFASDLADGMVDADYTGLHYAPSGQKKMAANLAPYLEVAPPAPDTVFNDGPGLYRGTTQVLAY